MNDEAPPKQESEKQPLQSETPSCCSCLPVAPPSGRAGGHDASKVRILKDREFEQLQEGGRKAHLELLDHPQVYYPRRKSSSLPSPHSPVKEHRTTLLSEEILIKRGHFDKVRNTTADLVKTFPTKTRLREVCRRFQTVFDGDRQLLGDRIVQTVRGEIYSAVKKQQDETQLRKNESRGNRGKRTMQTLVAVNVLHGLAQLVLGIVNWDEKCDYPFAELLITCGVSNIFMVTTYILLSVEQDVLWPVDEDDDEEMGWPLHVAGFVIWLCWIIDFSAWIILCMVYRKSNSCENALQYSAFSTVVIRSAIIAIQLVLIVLHLRNKIRAENKRKWGTNPFKASKKGKYLGEVDDAEYELQVEKELKSLGYGNQEDQFTPRGTRIVKH